MTAELRLTDVSAPIVSAPIGAAPTGGGCGASCSCGHHGTAGHTAGHTASAPAQRFEVSGMTCAHCVASVTDELSALGGVERVDVDLAPGTASTVTVTADRPLTRDEIRAAVEDAGYSLAR